MYLSPPEREIYLKAFLGRDKDFKDLKAYNENIRIRNSSLKEIMNDLEGIQGGKSVERVRKNLKEAGLEELVAE